MFSAIMHFYHLTFIELYDHTNFLFVSAVQLASCRISVDYIARVRVACCSEVDFSLSVTCPLVSIYRDEN